MSAPVEHASPALSRELSSLPLRNAMGSKTSRSSHKRRWASLDSADWDLLSRAI